MLMLPLLLALPRVQGERGLEEQRLLEIVLGVDDVTARRGGRRVLQLRGLMLPRAAQ